MSISFRSASTSNTGNTSGTSVSASLPPGTAQNDILVAALFLSTSSVSSAPSGYTAVTGSPLTLSSKSLNVYTRVVGSSEPAPSWSFSSAASGTLVIAAFVGGNTPTPQDATPTTNTSTSNTFLPTPPAITTTTDGDMIVPIIAVDSAVAGVAFTAPESGYSQAGTASNQFAGDGWPVQIAYKLQATHGTETPGSATLSNNCRNYVTFTLALKGPGPVPPATIAYCMGILNA